MRKSRKRTSRKRTSRKRTSLNKSKGHRGKKYSLDSHGLFNRNPPQGSECRFYHDEYPRQDARRDLANYTSQEYRDFFNMNLNPRLREETSIRRRCPRTGRWIVEAGPVMDGFETIHDMDEIDPEYLYALIMNAEDVAGNTILIDSVSSGDYEKVLFLIEFMQINSRNESDFKRFLNKTNRFGENALFFCIVDSCRKDPGRNFINIFNILIWHGIDLDEKRHGGLAPGTGTTLLEMATRQLSIECVKKLLYPPPISFSLFSNFLSGTVVGIPDSIRYINRELLPPEEKWPRQFGPPPSDLRGIPKWQVNILKEILEILKTVERRRREDIETTLSLITRGRARGDVFHRENTPASLRFLTNSLRNTPWHHDYSRHDFGSSAPPDVQRMILDKAFPLTK